MSDRDPSRTAIGVAALRAMHQELEPPPPVLDDPVTAELLGPETMARLRATPERFQTPGARALRAHVVLRSRFAEDRWQQARAAGVEQFVILGAGLDTFAWRQPAWSLDARVFEIDQPASQAHKRALLAAAGLAVPPNTSLVAVDFEREPLDAALARAGVRRDRPACFSWLGVMMYLEPAAVDTVFRTIAAWPAPSEIIYSFAPPAGPGEDRLARRAAGVGEPWRTRMEPDQLRDDLLETGFSHVAFLGIEEAEERYFPPGPGRLDPPRRVSIGIAEV